MKTSTVWKITVLGKSWKKGIGEVHNTLSWSWHRLQFHRYEPLQYNLNVTTVPEFGKIFCFKSPMDIHNFVNKTFNPPMSMFNFVDFIVFQGIAENPIRQKMMSSFVAEICYFWKAKQKKRAFEFQKPTPPGTITCTAFTPTKRYTWDEFVKEFPEPSIWSNFNAIKEIYQ